MSQLTRYAIGFVSYRDFPDIVMLITKKLQNQGFNGGKVNLSIAMNT